MSKKNKSKKKKIRKWKRVLRWRVWNLSKHWKLRERIAKGNQWAKDNPKKFFHWTVGVLSFFLVLTIIFSIAAFLTDEQKKQKPLVGENGEIENIQPMFDGLHNSENNKKVIKSEVHDITDEGLEIKKELDSLVALPYKTHEDSVQMYRDYKRLESIVNFLKKGKGK